MCNKHVHTYYLSTKISEAVQNVEIGVVWGT